MNAAAAKASTGTLDVLATVTLRGMGEWAGPLRNPSPMMRETLAAAPGFAESLTPALKYQALEEGLRSRVSDDARLQQVTLGLLGKLQDGQDVSATEMQAAVAEAAQSMNARLMNAVAESLRTQLIGRCQDTLAGGADRMRAHLHSRLVEIVTEAQTLDVAAIPTAEAAIAANRASDYRRLQELAVTMLEVRRVQTAIERADQGNEFGTARVNRVALVMRGAATAPGFAAWALDAEDDRWPWPDISGSDAATAMRWLHWLVTTPSVTAWVPSQAQVNGEVVALREARQTVRDARDDGNAAPRPEQPFGPAQVSQARALFGDSFGARGVAPRHDAARTKEPGGR